MNISKKQQFENFRMYHQLQYERIDKLETKREIFSNIVITLSSGFYLFGLGKLFVLGGTPGAKNVYLGGFLLVLIILINICSILFANNTRVYIKMHQKRAKKARSEYASQLNKINKQVKKKNSNRDFFSRNRIYKYLHVLLIVFALFSLLVVFCEKK
ncbi:MAG: hypothetical protein JKX79_02775 [Labilibaculum sp.]|nr:hypothetical protein [Labilibaculum sp.]